jgi:hypothetical protein
MLRKKAIQNVQKPSNGTSSTSCPVCNNWKVYLCDFPSGRFDPRTHLENHAWGPQKWETKFNRNIRPEPRRPITPLPSKLHHPPSTNPLLVLGTLLLVFLGPTFLKFVYSLAQYSLYTIVPRSEGTAVLGSARLEYVFFDLFTRLQKSP